VKAISRAHIAAKWNLFMTVVIFAAKLMKSCANQAQKEEFIDCRGRNAAILSNLSDKTKTRP
jgi:hypothetical protein